MRKSTSRREFLKTTALGAAATALPSFAGAAGAGGDRPNLVFVFSDQQSYDMLGCYGNKEIITPNIDAFATEGVRFAQCVSNQPVCTPYRGMLLTGQHPLQSGAFKNDVRAVPGGGKYFGEVLRDAGYQMGYFGKWHLYGGDRNRPIPAGPYRYGFDGEFLTNNCTLQYDAAHAYYWDADGKKQLYGDWEPCAQTRQAMKFIERCGGKPFAVFLSWHPPHNWGRAQAGYNAPEDMLKLYDPAKLTLRPNVADTPRHRQMYQGHMAMCTSLDKSFGELTALLKARGLAENTVVVYTSDHGDLLMSHNWPGNKGVPQNESCHVPLLIRWPRRLRPRVSEMLVGTLDLMPTLLDLMGLKVPDTCQGRDLADAVRAGRDEEIESVPLFYFPSNWRGVYTRRYTYAFDLPGGGPEDFAKRIGWNKYACLYDRQADPHEMKNLYDSPEHRDLRDKLHAQALTWMKKFGDTGVPFADLVRAVVVAEDIGPSVTRGDGPFGQGRLKGRPIDILEGKEPTEQ